MQFFQVDSCLHGRLKLKTGSVSAMPPRGNYIYTDLAYCLWKTNGTIDI